MAEKSAEKPASFARRDKLIDIQKKAQKRWAEEKIFEEDAPADASADVPKHFVTFPYPCTNCSK
jgi:leucyl-tRNA synthetase